MCWYNMCADDTIGNNIIIITRKLWVMDHGSRGSWLRRSWISSLKGQMGHGSQKVNVKLNDFLESQKVAHSVEVVISRKRCKIETLLQITNRK